MTAHKKSQLFYWGISATPPPLPSLLFQESACFSIHPCKLQQASSGFPWTSVISTTNPTDNTDVSQPKVLQMNRSKIVYLFTNQEIVTSLNCFTSTCWFYWSQHLTKYLEEYLEGKQEHLRAPKRFLPHICSPMQVGVPLYTWWRNARHWF